MTPEEFNQEIEKAYKIQQNLKKMLTKLNNNRSTTKEQLEITSTIINNTNGQ
jgi:hypothetical protein